MQVLCEKGNDICVLEKDGVEIGRARIVNGKVECWIAPEWRRKGYGTFLLKKTLHQMGISQSETLTAQAYGGEGPFYEKFGFQAVGEGRYRREREKQVNALSIVHDFWEKHLTPGCTALDATAGNGHDTVLLCRLAGPTGRVLAMDIQKQAVENTRERLQREHLSAQVIQDSHENIAQYIAPNQLDAAVFNLGYLPGGAHDFFTVPARSIPAMDTALSLLKPGGILTVCAYSGKLQGTHERDAVLEWANRLGSEYDVKTETFETRSGLPPIAVCVRKHLR